MNRLWGLCTFFGVSLTILLGSGTARADFLTYKDSIALTTTNWNKTVSLPKFDPKFGTLVKIKFELSGKVKGTVQYESLDAAPADITAKLEAELTLKRPDSSTLAVVLPTISSVDSVSAFDGTIDFGGTSGKSFTDVMVNKAETAFSPPPISDLGLFTGVGNILLPVSATGKSSATGAGNIVTAISTMAGADVTVTYEFIPLTSSVPEPTSICLLLLGGAGFLGYRKIRNRQPS